MKSIGERLQELENMVTLLTAELTTLKSHIGDRYTPPTTFQGDSVATKQYPAGDVRSGFGASAGKLLAWNNKELDNPANQEPTAPSVGYNKHTHTRFSGGALLMDGLEIVEYDFTKKADKTPVPEGQRITNLHSQGFWPYEPKIQTALNSKGEEVPKIGQLILTFAPDIQKWGSTAFEIDVTQCYFVKRRQTANKDENGDVIEGEDVGDIEKDSKGQEMKAPLMVLKEEESTDPETGESIKTLVVDDAKTSIVWDENGQCWRLYAAYAPGDAGV